MHIYSNPVAPSFWLVVYWLINTPPHKLISGLTKLFGFAVLIIGFGLFYAGRFIYGSSLFALGFMIMLRSRAIAKKNALRGYGCIRSAVGVYIPPLKGKLEGMVLAGEHEGKKLTSLSQGQLLAL